MKNSQFNYFLKYDSNTVLFNTLTSRLVLMDPLLENLYQAAVENEEVAALKAYHETFYDHLEKNRFIVDSGFDEVEQVRKIMNTIDNDDSRYYLIINPTMNCNFKCWYCYESHIKASKMDENTVENIYNHVINIFNENDRIRQLTIGWFGGEPLLYFDKLMIPMMEKLGEFCAERDIFFDQNITTNGFLLREDMIHYFKKYNLGHFQITLDGNRFVHDTVRFVSKARGSYDDILNNMKLLVRHALPVTARINFTKSNLDGIEEIYDDLHDMSSEERKYFDISFHQVWQETATDLTDRLDYLINYFRERGITTRDGNIPNNLVGSCYADKKNHATINYDGNVFKCTARDFNETSREGILNDEGNIIWNEKFHSRMDIKLRNKPCHSCGILPLCNGGCSQVAIEANGEDFCVYNFDEDKKREIVYRKVKDILHKQAVPA
ncbi:radical SAM/SPASM domain-containing protein [Sphingobacterium paludis]|uniref:Radical SAM core domain-containing protein n=1 Tax=Sphingobacterium paludis TaxID=1476465 RepID=A0A4R7D1L0_9SPHI|nr:radical SAM protein [Sphingobacterium paludis]TDS14859.1 uncharacterized protein B0I21_103359 [Sphingobacterium paludis]